MTMGATQSAPPIADETSPLSLALLEQRLAGVIEAYDAFGNHRSGTAVDRASAEWLAGQAQRVKVKAALEPFSLDRVDPQVCHLRLAGRCIGGVPLFDAGFTGSQGVRGRLGPLGSDAEIGLTETEPFTLVEPQKEQSNTVMVARQSRHKAVILLTRGSTPGLFLLNALSFAKPSGPPMLQVSNVETRWLKQQAEARAEATVTAKVHRTSTQAFNVTATISGSNPALPPLVIMTPHSGWWQCASERGGGIACWLEVMRALAAQKPARDCHFVACSGHELGFLGIGAYLESRPDLTNRALRWIHLGANIGSPRQSGLIHASDNESEQWAVALMNEEGLSVRKANRDSVPRGEAGALHRGRGRYVTLVCGTEVFHHPADRWPDAIDLTLLAAYARTIAKGVVTLAG